MSAISNIPLTVFSANLAQYDKSWLFCNVQQENFPAYQGNLISLIVYYNRCLSPSIGNFPPFPLQASFLLQHHRGRGVRTRWEASRERFLFHVAWLPEKRSQPLVPQPPMGNLQCQGHIKPMTWFSLRVISRSPQTPRCTGPFEAVENYIWEGMHN